MRPEVIDVHETGNVWTPEHRRTVRGETYSRQEVADLAGVSPWALDQLHRDGGGPVKVFVGGEPRYLEADVSAWLAGRGCLREC